MSLYLDYNASAPILPEVLDAMIETYQSTIGNADSRTHIYGTNAQKAVQLYRANIAAILGVNPDEIIFTSGSTESNNTAILGIEEYARSTGKTHIISTAIEHKSVLEPLKVLEKRGFQVDYIEPDISGRIDTKNLCNLITDNTCLVSIMYVNSETGIMQPVEEIGAYLRNKGVYFHIDATQALGKLNPQIRKLNYDIMSITSHKIGGPQGIGALILKRDSNYNRPPLTPLMYGGSQERGFRPGTTPIALVSGFSKAVEICERDLEKNTSNCRRIKQSLLSAISNLPYTFNGEQEYCLPSTANISIDGLDAETAFLCLGENYSFSNGSACNSSSHSLSYVLKAMGLDEKRMSEAIRLSWDGSVDIDFSPFVSIISLII